MTLMKTEQDKGSVARYTQDEKDILFDLFKAYEEIIDIKRRKHSRRKTMEVRQCWQEIFEAYNGDSRITTRRNLKQLQKFWLNARLRKNYPSDHDKFSQEKNYSLERTTNRTIKKLSSNLNSICSAQSTPKQEGASLEPRIKYEIQILNPGAATTATETSNRDTSAANESTQISIEALSNDNISLHDLLEFRNSNQDTEITEAKSTINSGSNNITCKDRDEVDDENTPTLATIYYTNVSTDDEEQQEAKASSKSRDRQGSSRDEGSRFDQRINSYRIKEAEMKLKEQQLKTERQKVELEKSCEELKHLKAMHQLQLLEMRMKLKLLEEDAGKVE